MPLLGANPSLRVNLGFRLNVAAKTMFAQAVNIAHVADRQPDAIPRRFPRLKARRPPDLSVRRGRPARRESRGPAVLNCHRVLATAVFAAFRPHRQPTRDPRAYRGRRPLRAREWPGSRRAPALA